MRYESVLICDRCGFKTADLNEADAHEAANAYDDHWVGWQLEEIK